MADEEMEDEAPAGDGSVGLATALIVLTTVMLILAFVAVEKTMGTKYNEGIFKQS